MDTQAPTLADEYFQFNRTDDLAIIVPSPEVEQLPENLLQTAASMLLAPLKDNPPLNIVVDLTGVRYFGSAFIQFLLRCHQVVKPHGSELVLAGVNDRVRELLSISALDTIWALYDTRQDALDALGGVD